MDKEALSKSIRNKNAKICIIGIGQVGLPTALAFCKAGFQVIGCDINKSLLSTLNSKKSPFKETGLDELLDDCIEKGKFSTSSNIEDAVKESNVIIICVSTLITKDIRPDLSALVEVCRSISEVSLAGKLIVFESSIPPGTFEELSSKYIKKKNNVNFDTWIVFVPERFAPGKAFLEIRKTPRVIGCNDEDSGILAKSLYEAIVEAEIFRTNVKVAEISKLVENTFRDVNVAFANEIGIICEKYGVDVAEIIRICNSHPRVNLLQPGPGVGGPCLTKDPYLLLHPQVGPQIESKIILNSRKINDSMPYHVVDLVKKALKQQNKNFKDVTVLILGVAYKANISDTRLSPAEEVITQLIKNRCKVLVFDPKTRESFGGEAASDIWKAISSSDVIVVVTDHEEFKKLDLKQIQKTMKKKPIIVDTRRLFDNKEAENLGINYLSVGYSKNLIKSL